MPLNGTLHGRTQALRPTNRLCSACQLLDLSPGISTRDLSRIPKQKRESIGKTRRCPSCQLFRFCLVWYLPIDWHPEAGFCVWRDFNGETGISPHDGSRIVFLNEPATIPPHAYGRIVEPQVNIELFKKWLTLCTDVHGKKCAPLAWTTSQAPGGLRVFRVVDVENMCIVETSPDCRYLTLSYVWGEGNKSLALRRDNRAQLMTPGSLRVLLPKTIRDAVNLVRILGETYIWIDCLCLIQDDPDDMHNGIQNMDVVYEGSALCIVAGSGKHANFVLPGLLPGTRDVQQNIREVSPGVKMMEIEPFYSKFLGTTYMERGWTLVISHLNLHRTD
jgi:hypothetical protein